MTILQVDLFHGGLNTSALLWSIWTGGSKYKVFGSGLQSIWTAGVPSI